MSNADQECSLKLPSNLMAGRPKAALQFLFFGDFKCGVPLLSLFLLYINIKIGKK